MKKKKKYKIVEQNLFLRDYMRLGENDEIQKLKFDYLFRTNKDRLVLGMNSFEKRKFHSFFIFRIVPIFIRAILCVRAKLMKLKNSNLSISHEWHKPVLEMNSCDQ